MEKHRGSEPPIHDFDEDMIPILAKGVYLIEEEYKGEIIYVVYIPNSNFGFRLSEPLYRFLCLCSYNQYSMKQIIDKLLEDFEVEREVLEQDVAQCASRLKQLGVIG
jgi:hypothetical protein